MIKILITGKDSYIGTSFEKWMQRYSRNYIIDTVDVRGDEWKECSFKDYDAIFHVAGIAHVSSDPKLKDLYYKVNRDLTVQIAEKAKLDGVKHFIFMSSIIVYGDSAYNLNMITSETVPRPSDFYGDSKLQAETGLCELCDSKFLVSIIRPPMIYGPQSKGNYPRLAKLARITPIFPMVRNERSMLFIDHLNAFIKGLLDYKLGGIFYPQNREFVNTSKLVEVIARSYNKNVLLIPGFGTIIRFLVPRVNVLCKIFGSLKYDQSLSRQNFEYSVYSFEESIMRTEHGA